MPVPDDVVKLVERFERNIDAYRSADYKEARVRAEFIDPFFEALGWDVRNTAGYAEAYKDVIHEDSMRVGMGQEAPDYCFRIGGMRKFFVEAKRPGIGLDSGVRPAYQLRRYAWSAKLPLSILTSFREFAVYDCRIKPNQTDKPSVARVMRVEYRDYAANWDEIASRFSKEAILQGSFDRYADSARAKRGTAQVDDAFLKEIESWRDMLARSIAHRNPALSQRELNFAVQRTIDRIVFLRICEDRGTENYAQLMGLVNAPRVYERLLGLFRQANDRYNSGLFHFQQERGRAEAPDELTLSLKVDDTPLRRIIKSLYYPDSPYEFSVLPADILGQVYEQFLGKVIRLTPGHQAKVEDKPEVKKAGGVYYTPTYIVDYIVENTVGKLVEGKTPKEVEKLRILDPACGSGSFLIAAYQYLLNWHAEHYSANDPERWARAKPPRVYSDRAGWRLTNAERKRILVNSIFGVDIDSQAVEVTKLSLLLKILEGQGQLQLGHERMLPDLGGNIKCGNSLIGSDYYSAASVLAADEDVRTRVNPFDWDTEFGQIAAGGFDAVIGNPPYVLLQADFRDEDQLDYFRRTYDVASYKIDTYHLFIEKGIRLTSGSGYSAMITPANFLTNNHLVHLRRAMLELACVDHIVVIDGGVFPRVSVDNAIFVVRRGRRNGQSFNVAHAVASSQGLSMTSAPVQVSRAAALRDPHVLFTGGKDAGSGSLWDRVCQRSTPLDSVAWVNFGKQLRDRRVYQSDVRQIPKSASVPDGYLPCYTGNDVSRYRVEWKGLICIDDEQARRGGCWDPDRHSAVNKLLTRQVAKFPEFGMDLLGYHCLNTVFMVTMRAPATDPRFIIGVLNSRVIRALWLDRFYDQRRTFPKIKGTYLKTLPIPQVDPSDTAQVARQQRLIDLVDSMIGLHVQLAATRLDHDETATRRLIVALEEQIDQLVYELYGLTEDEIKIVEGASDGAA